MKRLITTAAAATLFLAAPVAAFAGDRGHGYGGWGPPHHGHGWKHGHGKHGYWRGAPSVYYPAAPVYYPAAPVYFPPTPVYVPPTPVYVPAPVVAVPAPYPYPQGPVGNVSIGFRFFF